MASHDCGSFDSVSTAAAQRDRSAWERLAATLKPEGRAFIGGRCVPARDGRVFEDLSPIDGRPICTVARCGAEDVASAVSAARESFERGVWRRLEPKERKRILRRFAEAMRADADRLFLGDGLFRAAQPRAIGLFGRRTGERRKQPEIDVHGLEGFGIGFARDRAVIAGDQVAHDIELPEVARHDFRGRHGVLEIRCRYDRQQISDPGLRRR